MLSRTREEAGQGLTEYALVLVLVALAVLVALTLLGEQLADTYQSIIDQLPF